MVQCDALSKKCMENIEDTLTDIKDIKERALAVQYLLDHLNKKFGYEVQRWWRREYYRKKKEGII